MLCPHPISNISDTDNNSHVLMAGVYGWYKFAILGALLLASDLL